MSHGERSHNLKFHNDPNSKRDKDSWEFASPVYTRYPLMLQLDGLLPWLTRGPNLMAGWTAWCLHLAHTLSCKGICLHYEYYGICQ